MRQNPSGLQKTASQALKMEPGWGIQMFGAQMSCKPAAVAKVTGKGWCSRRQACVVLCTVAQLGLQCCMNEHGGRWSESHSQFLNALAYCETSATGLGGCVGQSVTNRCADGERRGGPALVKQKENK